MKNKIRLVFATIFITLIISSFSRVFPYSNSVKVNLPSFKITLNGREVNNSHSKYPLIVYKDITYFPMTYAGCRYLGLETVWDEKSGLEINKTNVSYPYELYTSNRNLNSYMASKPLFDIKINGKAISNTDEDYPLLVFRDITYFPLTWKYVVTEFGWDYHFDNKSGLVINSQNIVPKKLELKDYLLPGDFNNAGHLFLDDEYIYYGGNKGAIYKSPIDNLKNNKKIFETPLNYFFGDNTYGYPYFLQDHTGLFFEYHVGGASTGSTYKVFVNEDDTTTEPMHDGPYIGLGRPGVNLDWATVYYRENFHIYRVPKSDSNNYDEIYASNNIFDNYSRSLNSIQELHKIAHRTLQRNDKSIDYKYENEKLYYVSDDNKLYSISLAEDQIKLESNGPLDTAYRENYEVSGENVYYINNDDRKVYKEGALEPLNFGEIGESIRLIGNYIVIKYESTVNNTYKTVIYDRMGNEVLKTPRDMQIISSDNYELVYYDDGAKGVLLVDFTNF